MKNASREMAQEMKPDPSKKFFVSIWTVFPVLMVFAGISCRPGVAKQPNVLIIIVDDLGWKDLGVYGSTFYETPNIDRLASEGARFTQFYTASPVCSPTRASIMTGRHPARLHLTNWIGGEQNGILKQADYVRQLPHEEVTIGEVFRDLGYRTGYIGKWHLGVEEFLASSQGFDYQFAVNNAGQPGSYFPPYQNSNWSVTNVPDLETDSGEAYLTDRLADAAVEFIKSESEDPFFLVLSHYAVHTPLQAPENMIEKYSIRAAGLEPESDDHFAYEREASTKLRQDHPTYAAMIESVDHSVGTLMGALKQQGIGDRTIVIIVSDNGGLSTLMNRSFNQATSNSPLRAGKGWLYEGGIRAPLVIWYPETIKPGTEVVSPTLSTDLFPTLLHLSGHASMPELHLDGNDLVNVLALNDVITTDTLYWHFPHYHGSGNRPGGAIRAGNYKLMEWFEDGNLELYDLSTDLSETNDLFAILPELSASLHMALQKWRERVGAVMPTRVGNRDDE